VLHHYEVSGRVIPAWLVGVSVPGVPLTVLFAVKALQHLLLLLAFPQEIDSAPHIADSFLQTPTASCQYRFRQLPVNTACLLAGFHLLQ
jgi:hypothetical protein